MKKILSLSISICIVSICLSANASSFGSSDRRRLTDNFIYTNPSCSFINPLYSFDDTIPAPKTGLLTKLLQALQFRKNARAREQARVLDIIARSGLKDSLKASVRAMDSINTLYKITAMSRQENEMKNVLDAIDSLTSNLKKRTTKPAPDNSGGLNGQFPTDVDVPADDQDIQDLVRQVLAPVDLKQQDQLAVVRQLLRQKGPLLKTEPVNDSTSRNLSITLRNRTEITGFYPYPENKSGPMPDLRLIDELSWYAAGFQGTTGKLTGLNDWETSAVMDSARRRGCRISLSVMSKDRDNIASFLKSATARQQLIGDLISTLNHRNADGVIILFDSLTRSSRDSFTSFITTLADRLKTSPNHYRLSVGLPAYDRDEAYNIPLLKIYTDRFILDLTRPLINAPGPVAPLTGTQKNDLQTCITRYLDMNIPPSQLVARLPWYGVAWKATPGRTGLSEIPEYITYSDIRKDTQLQHQIPVYDSIGMTLRIDMKNRSGALRTRLWYDDERTLEAKYDFILHNLLGGIAIQALPSDQGYGDLWNTMALNLTRFDTVKTETLTTHRHTPALDDWQWSWTYISAKLEQYEFLLAYPCETKFPKVLIRKWQEAGVKNNSRKSIWLEATTVMGTITVLLAMLSIGGVLLFISRIRQMGDRWKWKKPLAGLLVFLFILLTVGVFMFLFLDKSIVTFGVSDSPQDCFDFPLGILFSVIFTGLAVGILITRFFIFPLTKQDDIP